MDSLHDLDGLRGPPVVAPQPRDQVSMEQKCQESKSWASRAPGLKMAIAVALRQWFLDMAKLPKLKPSMKPLGVEALRQWKQHFENDHVPARRDCRYCVEAEPQQTP